MKKLWIGIGIVVVVVLAIVLSISQTKKEPEAIKIEVIKKEPEVIKIGAILPLTGNVAVFGEWIKNGIEMGLEHSEFKGKIKIIYEDSQNDAKVGISALNKLVTIDHVDIVIAAMSKVAIPIIPVTEEKGIPLLLQDVTYPNITQKGKMVFRHFIQSDREGEVLSEYASKTLGIKRVAIFYVNDEAGLGAKTAFEKKFSAFGEVISEESYEATESDMRTHITKLMNKNPEAIFLFGNGPSWALALKQLKEMGYKGKILTNTAMYIPNFRKLAGSETIEGVYFTYPFMDTARPVANEFVKLYQDRYGIFPPIEAGYAYDLIRFVTMALKSKEGKSIYEKLLSIKQFEGAFGNIKIGDDRDMKTKIGIGVIKNGQILTLEVKE